MISILARRIQATCREDISLLRRQMHSIAWQEVRQSGVEGAIAMVPQYSCINHDVSVSVVCFTQPESLGEPSFIISVAMNVSPDRRTKEVYWAEADAWAQAIAGPQRFMLEFRGGVKTLRGRVFHYALTENVHGIQVLPLDAEDF